MNLPRAASAFVLTASVLLVAGAPSQAAVKLDHPSIKATADLSDVTFFWKFPTAPGSDGGNVNIQIFVQNLGTGEYIPVSPKTPAGAPVKLGLIPDGTSNSGSFTVTLPVGRYGAGKVVLFADGSNFMTTVASFALPSLDLTVKTDAKRITAPVLQPDLRGIEAPASDGKLHVPYAIKYPAGSPAVKSGLWVMIKGVGVFKQDFVKTTLAQHRTSNSDEYEEIDGVLIADMPTKPGVYSAEMGLFDTNWKMLQWVYPGIDYDFGDWIVRADPARYPSVAQAVSAGKAPFFLGGNFGNAIATLGWAANDSPTYYKLLHVAAGITILRENFEALRYEADPLYRKKISQIAENMWSAGVVPCFAPQDMPPGSSLAERAAKLESVDKHLAADFAGKPVIIDVLNEPHEYKSWAEWKPVAIQLARAVKAADPKAFVVVDSEGYAEDMTGASESPIGEGLVDLYGWHSYHASVAELPKKAGHGIPVWLEEYHNPSAAFHATLAKIPNLKGVAAWAWTTPGQDGLPLVKAVDGAQLTLSADGEKIARYYRTWRDGDKLDVAALEASEPVAPPPAAPAPAPAGGGGMPPQTTGLTVEQVREIARQVFVEMSAKAAKSGKK